eukprot:2237035-Amphidinium_carterae.1
MLRIESEELADHYTVRERMGLILATIRGASVSGLLPRSIISLVCEYIVDEVLSWNVRGSPEAIVAWQFPAEAGYLQSGSGGSLH